MAPHRRKGGLASLSRTIGARVPPCPIAPSRIYPTAPIRNGKISLTAAHQGFRLPRRVPSEFDEAAGRPQLGIVSRGPRLFRGLMIARFLSIISMGRQATFRRANDTAHRAAPAFVLWREKKSGEAMFSNALGAPLQQSRKIIFVATPMSGPSEALRTKLRRGSIARGSGPSFCFSRPRWDKGEPIGKKERLFQGPGHALS